ncbi:MAG TPA: histidine kinase [Streptosporangiaceae bacterium]|nr:histidine kinase [Streptosporangiaceae bacterium]
MGWLRDRLGIRLIDVLATVLVVSAVEINVATGGGPGAGPLNTQAYVAGAVLAVPVLLRHKWPVRVLVACSVLLLIYYTFDRRDISPAPLLCLPLYDAAVAGALAAAIVIPAVYMTAGLFIVGASTHESLLKLVSDFLPSAVVLFLAIMLGEVVRSRRALATETADRLRLAEEEREAEAGRRVAEERLWIARELHDTVAHSMATITVQAASALHRLDSQAAGSEPVRDALAAIRDTSKAALADMRVTLGTLRADGSPVDDAATRTAGLSRLDALTEAVRSAGAAVSVQVEGEAVPLSQDVDHAAYRILQESLTNVLRHAGPRASAAVVLRYTPAGLTIQVTDNGVGAQHPDDRLGMPEHSNSHGLTGMRERASAVGGELSAGPCPSGGFEVLARLPVSGRPDMSSAGDPR